jgi:hypothetical protein
MMRTIASESCFVHGLLIVAVTWCAVVVGDDKTLPRAKDVGGGVGQWGVCELKIGPRSVALSVSWSSL